MRKVVSIYSGPIIAGLLLVMLGGLSLTDEGLGLGRDLFSGISILVGLLFLYNSIQSRIEA